MIFIPDCLVEDVTKKEQAPPRDGAGERLHFEKLEMIYSEILAFNRACRSVGFISHSQPCTLRSGPCAVSVRVCHRQWAGNGQQSLLHRVGCCSTRPDHAPDANELLIVAGGENP